MRKIWLVSLAILMSMPVLAESATGITLFPEYSVRQVTGVASGNQTTYHLLLRGGYTISSGWYFGMAYSKVSSSGAYAINETAIGNSVGYFYGYVSFVFTYYFTAKENEKNPDGDYTRSEGNGMQLDLGLTVPVGANVSIGPILVFRSMSYGKKADSSGNIVSDEHSQTFLHPFIGVHYLF